MPCIKDVYCLNKKFDYELEGNTISDGDISDAKEKDSESLQPLTAVWFECAVCACRSDLRVHSFEKERSISLPNFFRFI